MFCRKNIKKYLEIPALYKKSLKNLISRYVFLRLEWNPLIQTSEQESVISYWRNDGKYCTEMYYCFWFDKWGWPGIEVVDIKIGDKLIFWCSGGTRYDMHDLSLNLHKRHYPLTGCVVPVFDLFPLQTEETDRIKRHAVLSTIIKDNTIAGITASISDKLQEFLTPDSVGDREFVACLRSLTDSSKVLWDAYGDPIEEDSHHLNNFVNRFVKGHVRIREYLLTIVGNDASFYMLNPQSLMPIAPNVWYIGYNDEQPRPGLETD